LMDHDFLKGADRERPFTPPPERPIHRWLGVLLTLLALVYAGYRVIDWWNQRPPAAATTPAPTRPSQVTEQPSIRPLPNTATTPEPGNRIVTKCLANGKSTYSDGDCAAGAKASQVVTKENHNLMDAVRVPQTPPAAEPPVQSAVITQNKPSPDYAEMKAECAALNEHIKYLDAMARQPQNMQTHDWIRNERKNARDRQARIPCQ
jgi:hypothetical protein